MLGKVALAARPLSELSNHWSHRLYRVSFHWYLSMVENPAIKESASSDLPFVTKYFAAQNTAVKWIGGSAMIRERASRDVSE